MSRYSIEFSKNLDNKLSALGVEQNIDKYEMIDLALKTYIYLKEQTKSGNKVCILNDENVILENVIIP